MMYRRNAAQQPRRDATVPTAPGTMLRAVFNMLTAAKVWDAAWRENRRRERIAKRARWYASGHGTPNGAHECERRRRQIAARSLTVSNGLVMGAA